eukprot:SAG31_NODE_25562_length_459_cov_0.591667_1_plen_38_part_10
MSMRSGRIYWEPAEARPDSLTRALNNHMQAFDSAAAFT